MASASDGLVDSVWSKLRFASDAIDEVFAYWHDEGLRSSRFASPTDVAPPNRLGFEESDVDGEGEAEDGMDEAQNIWRDMYRLVIKRGAQTLAHSYLRGQRWRTTHPNE